MKKYVIDQIKRPFNIRIFISLLIFLLQFIYISKCKLPWISDEMGIWTGSNFFSGYGETWKQYNLERPDYFAYYGLLSALVYSPIMAICKNSVLAYQLCLIINSFFLVLSFNLAYKVASKLGASEINSIFMSAVAVIQYVNIYHATMMLNEILLSLWVWIILYILLSLIDVDIIEDKKKKMSIIFAVFLSLGYIIHSRCIVVWGIIFIIFLVYRMYLKKWLVDLKLFFLFIGIVFSAQGLLVKIYQQYFWADSGFSSIKNTPELVFSRIDRIFIVLIEDIKGMLTTFFSLIAAFSIETFGLCIIIFIAVILYVFYLLKDKNVAKANIKVILLIIFSIGCFIGMIFCQSILGHAPSRNKTYVYTRYAGPFLGPFLLIGLFVLFLSPISKIKIIVYSLLFSFMSIHWAFVNWPDLFENASIGKFDSAMFFCYKLMGIFNGDSGKQKIGLYVLVMFTVIAIILYLIYKNKIKIFSIFICCGAYFLLVFSIKNSPTGIDFSNQYYDKIKGSVNCFRANDFSEYKVYYYGENPGFLLPVQVMFYKNNLTCTSDFESIDLKEAFFISDSLIFEDKITADYVFQISEKEYWYTSCEEVFIKLKGQYQFRRLNEN